jgi:hypothetical protein
MPPALAGDLLADLVRALCFVGVLQVVHAGRRIIREPPQLDAFELLDDVLELMRDELDVVAEWREFHDGGGPGRIYGG